MKKLLNEFKEFALRGNVIDLAVGVIIGGAFQSIIKSFIDDLIMPFIGLATGGVNFTDQFTILRLPEGVNAAELITLTAAKDAGATVFAYGSFVTAVLNFIIMAFVIFLFVKLMNKMHQVGKKNNDVVEDVATTKVCPFCKSEIAIDATRCAHCTSKLEE